jgi:replicative DNA helicase
MSEHGMGEYGPSEVGRTPPHNLDAERSLLGALLIDPERIPEVSELLGDDDFYDRRHGLLFAVLRELSERNAPIDFVAVGEALRARGHFQDVGGSEGLVALAQHVTSSAMLGHHGRIVAETATLRGLIRESTEIVQKAYDTRPDGSAVQDLLDESENRIFQIARTSEVSDAQPIAHAITETFRNLDSRSGDEGLTGITTGFYELDETLSGLNKGELIIIAARPSMGKTAFALNLMENAAFSHPSWLDRRPSVLMFSLEMGVNSLVARMLCSRARVPAYLLRSGRLGGDLRQDLAAAADELQSTGIFIDDTPGISMMSLRSRARRLAASENGLDMIVVDYLQLLSFPRSESRQQEISSISRSLKELSRELEIPVVALAQLSRAVESRDPPRPQLADLRESGSIEQDADVVMMLYRPEYYAKYRTDENRGMAEVVIAKHRNGATGEIRLQFFPEHMRFENRAPTGVEQISI